jgi:hypothetical protein
MYNVALVNQPTHATNGTGFAAGVCTDRWGLNAKRFSLYAYAHTAMMF